MMLSFLCTSDVIEEATNDKLSSLFIYDVTEEAMIRCHG